MRRCASRRRSCRGSWSRSALAGDAGRAAGALRDGCDDAPAAFDYASVVRDRRRASAACCCAPRRRRAVDRVQSSTTIDALFRPRRRRSVLRYDDARRGIGRRVRVDGGPLAAVRLAGEIHGEAWLREWLIAGRDVAALGALLLVPSATPPGGRPLRGRIVCSCFDVAETRDRRRGSPRCRDRPRTRSAALQASLRCGTDCGSCVPELKRLVGATRCAA